MAAPWAAGARVRILGRVSGQQTVNVIHFATNTQGWDDPNEVQNKLRQLANAVKECILDTLVPAVTSDWIFDHVEATQIAPALSDPVPNEDVVQTAGTSGAQGVPFAAQLASIRTGVGGKTGRGRVFLPPGSEANATGGSWDPAALALVAAFCACMAGKFIGAGASENWRMGVLSRKIFVNTPGNFDNAFREALSFNAESVIAVMGTRKVGRGS